MMTRLLSYNAHFYIITVIIISELLPWLRKNNFTTSNRVNNTCGEVGVLRVTVYNQVTP